MLLWMDYEYVLLFFFSFLKKINKKILQFVIKTFTRKKKTFKYPYIQQKRTKIPVFHMTGTEALFFLPKCPKVAIAQLHLKYVAQS